MLRGAGDFQISKFPILKFSSFKFFNLQNLSFSNFKVSIFQISNFKLSNSQIPKFQKLGTHTFHKLKKFRFSDVKIICFKDVPIICLVIFKDFGDKYAGRGSRFGHIFGRCRNHPKSTAINQESLISHLGIIKTPQKNHNYLKKQENKQPFFVLPYFGPY